MTTVTTTAPDEMRNHLSRWEEMEDSLWKRKGYQMKPPTLEEAHTEQLQIYARRLKLRTRQGMTESKTTNLLRDLVTSLDELYPWADRNADELVGKEKRHHPAMMRKAKRALERFCKWQDRQ